jgi:biopolymer transport protein ExbD
MSMNVGSSTGEMEPMMDINTTPLIDVMLVLLIMLIITIPIQLHSVNINMPIGTPPPPLAPPEVIEIAVDFDGTVYWNAAPVPNEGDLEARLAGAQSEAVQPEIHLKPNKLVAYKYVAAVMAAVQRHGLTKFVIVGNEQFV